MATLIDQSFPKARKDHECMACDFLLDDLPNTLDLLTFTEKKAVVKAKRDMWKIKKGQIYVKQFCTGGGEVWTFKARIEIADIFVRLDLYPDI